MIIVVLISVHLDCLMFLPSFWL